MRFKTLLFALLLVAFALQAQAWQMFNDAALTPGSSDDRVMISAVTVSSTQTSIPFGTNDRFGMFTLDVTACTACNITFRLETQDGQGNWIVHDLAAAAVTATGTTRHLYGCTGGGTSAGCNAGASNYTAMINKPMPGLFRVSVVWNSGTSASYTVHGVSY